MPTKVDTEIAVTTPVPKITVVPLSDIEAVYESVSVASMMKISAPKTEGAATPVFPGYSQDELREMQRNNVSNSF